MVKTPSHFHKYSQSIIYLSVMSVLSFFADIDECAEQVINCEFMCHNTNGSYACSCDTGYTLAINGFSCISKNLFYIALLFQTVDRTGTYGNLAKGPMHLLTKFLQGQGT